MVLATYWYDFQRELEIFLRAISLPPITPSHTDELFVFVLSSFFIQRLNLPSFKGHYLRRTRIFSAP